MSPRTIVLSALGGGTLTLTASGGPVSWSITESPGLIGELAVTPASGRLLAGQSTSVSLRASDGTGAGPAVSGAGPAVSGAAGVCVSCTLTVNPGGITVTVIIEVNAPPGPAKPGCPPPGSSSPGTEEIAGCRNGG